MIRDKKIEWIKQSFYWFESKIIFPRKFNKIKVKGVDIRPNHSVLLLQNHFSWWDGFLGTYLAYKVLGKSYHVMVQEDQLKKHGYLRYKGAFSIKKNSREIMQSLEYTAQLLADPNNMVLVFPQGKLQSMHTEEIKIEKGVTKLIEGIEADCQVIYSAVVVDYLESFKPSITFHLLDCGTARDIQPEQMQTRISSFHKEALRSGIRK